MKQLGLLPEMDGSNAQTAAWFGSVIAATQQSYALSATTSSTVVNPPSTSTNGVPRYASARLFVAQAA